MSWQQLLAIHAEQVQTVLDEILSPPQACPNDGEPLSAAPDGGLFCRYDGWRPDA
jgi:hypothetical protein